MKRLLLWFSVGLILILLATTFIQQYGKTVAETHPLGSPTASTQLTPNSQSEQERLRLSAQLSQKIFSKFPEAKVDLNCFAKGKYGFMDTMGKLVIPMCFDEILPIQTFTEGVARVKFNSHHSGYINREGIFVIPPVLRNEQFDYNWEFLEDRLPLRREPNGKYGYIDRTGKFVIEPQFDEAYSFHEGRAGVCSAQTIDGIHYGNTFQYRQCGYIDSTGKVVIPRQFVQVRPFQNGFALVVSPKHRKGNPENEYLMGVIDHQGQFLVEPNLDFVGVHYRDIVSANEMVGFPDTFFASGLLRVRIPDSRTIPPPQEGDYYPIDPSGLGKWGFVRQTGGYAIEPRFWEAGDFSAERAVVRIGEDDTGYPAKWRGQLVMIDSTGRIIEPTNDNPAFYPNLASVGGFFSVKEGLLGVKANNNHYGFINRDAQWVIPPQFMSVREFLEGVAAAQDEQTSEWGYLNSQGKWVISPQFKQAADFSQGLAAVQDVKTGKWGYIDPQGHFVFAPQLDSGLPKYPGDNFGMFPPGGLVKVEVGGKWGLINRKGQYVLKPKYEFISELISGIVGARLDDRSPTIFVTESGKILPYASTNFAGISEGLIAVSIKLPADFQP